MLQIRVSVLRYTLPDTFKNPSPERSSCLTQLPSSHKLESSIRSQDPCWIGQRLGCGQFWPLLLPPSHDPSDPPLHLLPLPGSPEYALCFSSCGMWTFHTCTCLGNDAAPLADAYTLAWLGIWWGWGRGRDALWYTQGMSKDIYNS